MLVFDVYSLMSVCDEVEAVIAINWLEMSLQSMLSELVSSLVFNFIKNLMHSLWDLFFFFLP